MGRGYSSLGTAHIIWQTDLPRLRLFRIAKNLRTLPSDVHDNGRYSCGQGVWLRTKEKTPDVHIATVAILKQTVRCQVLT